MARPKIDLKECISRIPEHVAEMPPESASPIEHYRRGVNDSWNLLGYFERKAQQAGVYEGPVARHVARLAKVMRVTVTITGATASP